LLLRRAEERGKRGKVGGDFLVTFFDIWNVGEWEGGEMGVWG